MAMEVVPVTSPDIQKKNRIQVSNTKKPLFFYVNLAKRYIQQHNEVELSALGMDIREGNGKNRAKVMKYELNFEHKFLLKLLIPTQPKAITTVVTISEILKNNGLAIEKKVLTSTVGMKDESKGRLVQKARIEILLGKTENFDTLMTTSTRAPEKVAKDNEQDESEH